MTTPFWLPESYVSEAERVSTSKWDTITIGNLKLPGVVDVSGAVGNRLDLKQPKGRSSARLEFSGYRPADIKITTKIWLPSHWRQLQKLVSEIRPINSVAIPKAYDVAHPVLEAYNIRSIVIKSINLPASSGDGAGRQLKNVEIEAWEFIPIEWKKQESTGNPAGAVLSGSTEGPGLAAEQNNFGSDRRPPSETPELTGFKTLPSYKALIEKASKRKATTTKTPAALVVDPTDLGAQ